MNSEPAACHDEQDAGAAATTTVEQLTAGGLAFAIHCATPLEHLARCKAAAGADYGSSCATGTRVYEGSLLLAEFLLSACGRSLVQGMSVLELGCGCGVAGMAAAAAGAARVRLTDGNTEALRLCDLNLLANKKVLSERCLVDTAMLNWSAAGLEDYASTQQQQQEDSAAGDAVSVVVAPGIVIGADIVYYRVDCRELLGGVRALLHQGADTTLLGSHEPPRQGLALLCHAMRMQDGRRRLLDAATALGLSLFTLDVVGAGVVPDLASRSWGLLELLVVLPRPGATSEEAPASIRPFLRAYEEVVLMGEKERTTGNTESILSSFNDDLFA